MDPRQREATKVASSPDGSRTDSFNSLSDGGHGVSRKRSRDLDYSISQLTEMDYQKLKDESFDYIPAASNTISQRDLPDRNLPLSDQLQRVFNDRTQKDKGTRAMGFLDSFQTVMGKLKQARQQKRKAAQQMEEQIAKREEWVRKKRGVCELELGRLKSAGAAVVKPIKSRVR